MLDPTLVLTDAPSADAHRTIDDGLARHGVEQAGYWNARPLGVLIKDPATEQILGGLLGRTSLGLLFIDLVFVPEPLRGREIGTRILRMAEEEAMRRGCRAAVLYTISFQAPDFYEHRGWREFGRIPCDPPGTSRVFMTKEISSNRAPVIAS
jgi:GNAT superfamily N-acetyltransferase